MKEIINICKQPKSNILRGNLPAKFASEREISLRKHIVGMKMSDVILGHFCVYEPNFLQPIESVEGDTQWLHEFYEFPLNVAMPMKLIF